MLLAHPDNPARPVDWRWQYARWLCDNSKQPKIKDDYVGVIKRYIVAQAKCQDDDDYELLSFKFPGIFWAEQLHEASNKQTRWAIEARLLSEEDPEEIAKKTRITLETIKWYELVYFNVTPYLTCRDYVFFNVIGRSIHAGLHERDYDLLWKMFGYLFGPIYLDYILHTADNPQRVTSPEMVRAASNDYIKGGLRRKALYAVATMPVAFNQNNILELYNKQVEIEKQSGGSSDAQATMITNVQSAMLAFGRQFKVSGERGPMGPLLKTYDDAGTELRASELLSVALGEDKPEYTTATNVTFPEKTDANEDQKRDRS